MNLCQDLTLVADLPLLPVHPLVYPSRLPDRHQVRPLVDPAAVAGAEVEATRLARVEHPEAVGTELRQAGEGGLLGVGLKVGRRVGVWQDEGEI